MRAGFGKVGVVLVWLVAAWQLHAALMCARRIWMIALGSRLFCKDTAAFDCAK